MKWVLIGLMLLGCGKESASVAPSSSQVQNSTTLPAANPQSFLVYPGNETVMNGFPATISVFNGKAPYTVTGIGNCVWSNLTWNGDKATFTPCNGTTFQITVTDSNGNVSSLGLNVN